MCSFACTLHLSGRFEIHWQEAAQLEETALLSDPQAFIVSWKAALIKDLGEATQISEKLSDMESQQLLAKKLEESCKELRSLKDFANNLNLNACNNYLSDATHIRQLQGK